MNRTWRYKRKMFFIILLSVFLLGFLIYKIYPYFNQPPSCYDLKQNSDERGVDCGGSCPTVCMADILPLEVKYSRAVESEPGLYDLIAIVENKNKDNTILGSKIDYNFKIYDKSGRLIKTVPGASSLPVGQTFPIIVQNVYLDFGDSGNAISRVVLEFSPSQSPWTATNPVYANSFFNLNNTDFVQNKNNISQLNLSFTNATKALFKDVEVRVVLSSSATGNVIAVNESLIKEVKGGASGEINFSWRNPVSEDSPKIDVYFIITPDTYIR